MVQKQKLSSNTVHNGVFVPILLLIRI